MKLYLDWSWRSQGCSLILGGFFTFGVTSHTWYFWDHAVNAWEHWLLFAILAGCIGGSNAEEVCPGEVEADSNEQTPDHECFLGLHGVSDNISTGENDVILVEPLEVDEIPDCKESEWDDSQHHSNPHSSSGSLLVLGEESDDENSSDNKWSKAQKGDWDVPPVDVFVQKAIEHLNEQSNCD